MAPHYNMGTNPQLKGGVVSHIAPCAAGSTVVTMRFQVHCLQIPSLSLGSGDSAPFTQGAGDDRTGVVGPVNCAVNHYLLQMRGWGLGVGGCLVAANATRADSIRAVPLAECRRLKSLPFSPTARSSAVSSSCVNAACLRISTGGVAWLVVQAERKTTETV